MRISLDRTGGFTGMRFSTTVDTDSLPPEEAGSLRAAVQSAGLLADKPDVSSSPGHPDQYSYRVTVVEGDKTYAMSIQERDVTPELRPLLDLLLARAKRGQRRAQ
jgi:hypothetical protein